MKSPKIKNSRKCKHVKLPYLQYYKDLQNGPLWYFQTLQSKTSVPKLRLRLPALTSRPPTSRTTTLPIWTALVWCRPSAPGTRFESGWRSSTWRSSTPILARTGWRLADDGPAAPAWIFIGERFALPPPPIIYKRVICHFGEWQVHLFIAKETNWLSQADTYYMGTSLPLFC